MSAAWTGAWLARGRRQQTAKAALSHLRDHRDDLCAAVRRSLSELRDVSRSLARRWPQAARYDLGEIPQQPHALHRYATIELDLLRDPLVLPEGTSAARN